MQRGSGVGRRKRGEAEMECKKVGDSGGGSGVHEGRRGARGKSRYGLVC